MKAHALTRRKKPERLLFEVSKGALVPADGYTAKRLRERGYKIGDRVLGDIRKPRNPGFWRLAHRFGQLVADSIDEFAGMDAHGVLKRLQIEGGIACDEVPAYLDIMGQRVKIMQRIPRSLSFADMEDGEFRETYRRFSDFVAATYWSGLSAEAIEQMAEAMPEAA